MLDNEPTDTTTAEPLEAAEAAPPKRPTRRRAVKKTAAPADTAPAKTTRRRATKATKAAKAAAAEAPAIVPAEQSPADDAEVTPDALAAEMAAPAVGDVVTDAPATEETEDEAGALFAPPIVLFKAPEPAKATPRRRRKAAEPAPEPEDVVPADETPETDVEVDAEIEPDADIDAERDGDSDESGESGGRRRRRRGRRGRGSRSSADAETNEDESSDEADGDLDAEESADHADEVAENALSTSARRRRRRRRSAAGDGEETEDDPPNTVTHVRETKSGRQSAADSDGVRGVRGSTRLEAKRQRRRDNRDSGRRRAPILTESEFLARREAVERVMALRQHNGRTQIAVLEDDILVEYYVTKDSQASSVGNVFLGRVQNVLPSMEAAFVDIGRGRNGVLYAGEVNWDAAGLEGKSRAIENAMKSGDSVLVQVTKDPIGHKGARLTSQISLPGRFVVYVPGGGMTGISRKLPDVERSRLKAILRKVVPDEAGVIVRTAAEGASEEDLVHDVERLKAQWESIQAKASNPTGGPQLVYGEPDLAIRVVRDVFNDDFTSLLVDGADIYDTVSSYVADVAPELSAKVSRHTSEKDLFAGLRVDEQLAKALDRKVYLPSGGSLVIDRTEAMVVIDVNTGKYTGSGGNLEQTVTRNNLEAAEEIVRQLRLRDVGGIIVIDFIDMVLESNRELVLRRLTECLGRDRTKHQVAEVTSLGLVQMTRKRVGEGLLEAFSEPCEHCKGRGVIIHSEPVEHDHSATSDEERGSGSRSRRNRKPKAAPVEEIDTTTPEQRRIAASAIAAIAAATTQHADSADAESDDTAGSDVDEQLVTAVVDLVRSEEPEAPAGATEPDDATAAAEPVPSVPEPAAAVSPAVRPRRRRAASRPAGPPAATEPVGS